MRCSFMGPAAARWLESPRAWPGAGEGLMLLWLKRLIYCNVVRRSQGNVGQRLALGLRVQPMMWSRVTANAAAGQGGLHKPCHQQHLGPHLGRGIRIPLENRAHGRLQNQQGEFFGSTERETKGSQSSAAEFASAGVRGGSGPVPCAGGRGPGSHPKRRCRAARLLHPYNRVMQPAKGQ